jgi:hypothetical protein
LAAKKLNSCHHGSGDIINFLEETFHQGVSLILGGEAMLIIGETHHSNISFLKKLKILKKEPRLLGWTHYRKLAHYMNI